MRRRDVRLFGLPDRAVACNRPKDQSLCFRRAHTRYTVAVRRRVIYAVRATYDDDALGTSITNEWWRESVCVCGGEALKSVKITR